MGTALPWWGGRVGGPEVGDNPFPASPALLQSSAWLGFPEGMQPGPGLWAQPTGHYADSPSTSAFLAQGAMNLGLPLTQWGVLVREERVSCPRLFVPVWARWLSRDLTPLGRCQHLICWDSLLGLPPFSPWPEAGERK